MSTVEATLLKAIAADPGDDAAWLALADCLEEQGQSQRAEVTRLNRELRGRSPGPDRDGLQTRLQELLLAGAAPCVPVLTNSIGMRLALTRAGAFLMGSPEDDPHAWQDEHPRHEVVISKPFYLGLFPVTQGEYRRVVGDNPSHFSRTGPGRSRVGRKKTQTFPVEMVDWADGVGFCETLSNLPAERDRGRVYRLPTEAEWEYACRAGTLSRYHFGETITSHVANFDGSRPFGGAQRGPSLRRTCAVGSYPANAWGVYDMHGNVWEWCADCWEASFYQTSPVVDPRGPAEGRHRILRGGSWKNDGFYLRSAHRGWSTSDERIGFRVLLEYPDQPQADAIGGGPSPRPARRRKR
jgi:uncharacterized protein (TIGR02996 family)